MAQSKNRDDYLKWEEPRRAKFKTIKLLEVCFPRDATEKMGVVLDFNKGVTEEWGRRRETLAFCIETERFNQ